jgi:hypothetical protein
VAPVTAPIASVPHIQAPNEFVTRAKDVRPEGAQSNRPQPFRLNEDVMRSTHVIIGSVSLVLAGCARLVPPDSIVALEGPQQVNLMVGATQPLKLVGTRGDGQTVKLPARTLRFSSTDPSVVKVTPDGRVQGLRMGRASISATLSTPVGPVSVNGIPVAVGALIAGK